MFKYFFVLAACISGLASADEKKVEIVECRYVTIVKVETDESGNQKAAVVHPAVLRCEPLKVEKPEEKTPRKRIIPIEK